MYNKRFVITGVGVLSPIGIGNDNYWKALAEGRSGIRPITIFDTSKFKIKSGGEITEFNAKEVLGRIGLVDLDRATTLLSSAMKFAIEDAGLKINENNTHRTGISVGTTFGSLHSLSEFDKDCLMQGPKFVNPSRFPNTVINSPASRAAIRFGIKGFNTTISTGFCSGLDALDYAVHALEFDRADRVLVGAVEEICLQTFLGFYQLKYLSGLKKGLAPVSRPFDQERDGIVFSEGATVVLLETLPSALERGVKVYAEVVSVASNFDPGGFHKYNRKATGIINAMQGALDKSGLEKEEIDCIFANANSTQDGDAIETKAIKAVFKKYAKEIPIVAIKSMIGETFSASGGMNLVAALGSLEKKFIPQIINYKTKDADCDLNYILKSIEGKNLNYIMVNCFDPSGANTVLILKKFKGSKK
ncbi:MAG: beta-ketoacyl-[acyl-carrier-protein] synthase family protein [Candidatus Omnitrophica bacterium]|nr:beta-ketoacyl-[acyl-carrier-protein] synthase family protein [Candidatus Omnitrophota bacterium]